MIAVVDTTVWPVRCEIRGDAPAIKMRILDCRYAVPRQAPVKVTLTERQRALSHALARLRNDPKEAAGVASKKLDHMRGELDAHIVGVESEMAVASLYGVELDTQHGLGGDAGSDLQIGQRRVEVKCRRVPGYDFALMHAGEMRSDAGVLVYETGTRGTYVIHGAITRENFSKNAKLVDYGYGQRRALSPDHCQHWSVLRYREGEMMGIPHQVISTLLREGWGLDGTQENGTYTLRRSDTERSPEWCQMRYVM